MYRKSGCIVKKTPFLQGKTEVLHRIGGFLKNKVLLCIENIRLYQLKKKCFMQGRNEILHRKRGFL